MEDINKKFLTINQLLSLTERIKIVIGSPEHEEFCNFLTENSCLFALYFCESCWKFIAYKLIKDHQGSHINHKLLTKSEFSTFEKF